jgi:DNA-binding GntR family transcriptional regulator
VAGLRALKRPSPPRKRAGQSLTVAAYERLKERIVRCELRPGQIVTEAQLVQELNIGKTPVREALARLVQYGLVRNLPRHGYQITPITLQDVRDLYAARLIIEPAAIELAAGHVDRAQLHHLDALCQTEYGADEASGFMRYLEASREFHLAVIQAAGNRRLLEIMERIEDESQRMFHLALMFRDYREQVRHGHQELVEALSVGDGQRARAMAIDAILASQRAVMEALISSPAVLATQVAPPDTSVA